MDPTHGGRVEREASLLGSALPVGQGVVGVFLPGRTIQGTEFYTVEGVSTLTLFFSDGTAFRLQGVFDASIREAHEQPRGMGVNISSGEPEVIELDPADVTEE